MPDSYDLSVVIPAFNESERIGKAIEDCLAYFDKHKYAGEVIVSDDHSTDDTVSIVKGYADKYKNVKLIALEKNYFKGWPVKMGMLEAKGNLVMFADADMATPITEAEKLKSAIEAGVDIAIGSRIQESGEDLRRSQPIYRRILGKTFSFIRDFLVRGIKDSQTGFKMFNKTASADLFARQKIPNIIFDVEILYMAKKKGYKITEIPVEWNYGGQTRMKVNLKNAVMTITSLVKIWWWHHSGR